MTPPKKKPAPFLKGLKDFFRLFKPVVSLYRICRKKLWLLQCGRRLKRYLEQNQVGKLQIGSGSNVLEKWFNIDIAPFYSGVFFMDAAKPFPCASNVFDYIFSEHVIEHLTFNEGLFMLRECYRILKRGSKIRITTPDLELLAGLYNKTKTGPQRQYIKSVMDIWHKNNDPDLEGFVINNLFGLTHKFIYDYQTIRYALESAGFVDLVYRQPGKSDEEEFRNIEAHLNDYIKFETLAVEARKP